MPKIDKYRVPWQKTCWSCNSEDFAFQCTDELVPLDRLIGQDRAEEALRFGLEVDKPGYNLFVTGLTGTGKTSAIKSHLQKIVGELACPDRRKHISDWSYVYNFDNADRPQVLRLPPGTGKTLRNRLNETLRVLGMEVPKVFKSEDYETQRRTLEEADQQASRNLMAQLEQAAQAASFGVQVAPTGVTIFPLLDNRPLNPEEYQALGLEQKTAIDKKRGQLMQQTQDVVASIREIEKGTSDKLQNLERAAARERVGGIFQDLIDTYPDIADLKQFLERLMGYVLDNLNLFKESETPEAQLSPGIAPPLGGATLSMSPFLPFEVNVLVDNSDVDRVPIIIEPNPNWGNLFGRIERRAIMGTYVSDHAMLKPGAFHLANGGYLVINARDVLSSPHVWEGLKRAIRNREVRLEDPTEQGGFFIPQGLRPEPIPLHAKVIVTGDETIYRLLNSVDQEDFWDLFKVKAEFDFLVELTDDNLRAYCAFICRICADEELLAFEAGAAAEVVEFAARLVADQHKLSTRFGQIKDLLIEADYWARKESCPQVQDLHVRQAVAHKLYRLNLVEERTREMVADGTLLLEVTGSVVGQVNGLAVYDLGDFSFGRPTRITTQTFAGREGIINIEREASLSGNTHDKGVLILSGYLGARYGQQRPLTLSATLCFEQSYSGVDGDSASSAEVYAIVSSLSALPLRQDIAVTGSVNQKGEIQPIGGVNQKIEGMFDLCRISGLTGTQGVLIPHQNLRNLMLRQDVVEAIREDKFHLYAIKTVDEGLEILTGHPAGKRRANGSYPESSVGYLVEKRLEELNQSMRGYYDGLLTAAS
jgi:predicted ATP-dependent protease